MPFIVIKIPRSKPGSGKLAVAVRSKNSTRAWVIFQSAHWVNFPSAPTLIYYGAAECNELFGFSILNISNTPYSEMSLNVSSIPLRVISLSDSIARRTKFYQNNRHLHFEFFSAIDGSALSKDDLTNLNHFIQPLYYSPGAYGCALSHLALWEECIAGSKPLSIFEDDAILRFDFLFRMHSIISSLPEDWDIIHWGWNFDAPLSIKMMDQLSSVHLMFDQDSIREDVVQFQVCKEDVYPFRLEHCFGTPAYSISPKGANKLMAICFPIRDFIMDFSPFPSGLRNNGIDIVMNQIYSLISAYVCFPPLAITPNLFEDSTIQRV